MGGVASKGGTHHQDVPSAGGHGPHDHRGHLLRPPQTRQELHQETSIYLIKGVCARVCEPHVRVAEIVNPVLNGFRNWSQLFGLKSLFLVKECNLSIFPLKCDFSVRFIFFFM